MSCSPSAWRPTSEEPAVEGASVSFADFKRHQLADMLIVSIESRYYKMLKSDDFTAELTINRISASAGAYFVFTSITFADAEGIKAKGAVLLAFARRRSDEAVSQVAAIHSAQTVAALRAAVTNETSLTVASAPLAKHFISLRERLLHAILQRLSAGRSSALPGSYGFAIARTRCFKDARLSEAADGIQRRDARRRLRRPAIRFADELKGVRVFEVDHPGTRRARSRLAVLRHRGSEERPVHHVDFNRDALEAELVKKGFSQPPHAVPVGRRLPLPPEAFVAGILRFVESCAAGSSIVSIMPCASTSRATPALTAARSSPFGCARPASPSCSA